MADPMQDDDPANVGGLAARIGAICSEPDDGERNYRVTVAYWDLSRIMLGYTHALDEQARLAELPVEEATLVEDGEEDKVAEGRDRAASEFTYDDLLALANEQIRRVLLATEPAADASLKPEPGAGADLNGQLDQTMQEILSEALRGYRPDAPDALRLNANFCTYATWSSLTLGRDIRNRLLPYRYAEMSSDVARAALTRVIIRARRANNNELARQLGHGQRTVLWEVGLSLLWLARSCRELDEVLNNMPEWEERIQLDWKPEVGQLRDKCTDGLVEAIAKGIKALHIAPLRNEDFSEWRYKDLCLGLASYHLARAFARRAHQLCARRARQLAAGIEPEASSIESVQRYWCWTAEMVLRGNLFIGAYEQHRVQTYLQYPLVEYSEQVLFDGEPRPRGSGEVALRRRISAQAARVFEGRLDPLWERFFTDQLLTIQIGDELLRLGRDLPVPEGQASMFPPDLTQLQDSWLRQLVQRYDHSLDASTGQGTQAHRWSNYDDRMSFVVNLMRSRAQLPGLWRRPFNRPDERRVRAGATPRLG